MPWKECKPMDERLRFIARLLEGQKMAPLCREFGISRVTGYKLFERSRTCSPELVLSSTRLWCGDASSKQSAVHVEFAPGHVQALITG